MARNSGVASRARAGDRSHRFKLGSIVPRRDMTRLLPIGLVLSASGLLLHNWMYGDYAESISGFLIGISLVFVIVGFMGHRRGLT